MALLDEIQVRVYRSYVKIPLIFFVPALTLLSIFSLAYFHANSPHAWRVLETQLHEVMGGHYSLGYVEFSPTLTGVEAYDVNMMTPDREPVIDVDELRAEINPLMLITGRLEFAKGEVDGARVRLEFDDDGELNLLQALGVYQRRFGTDLDEDRSRRAVGFTDVNVRDVEFEFVDRRFGFSIDAVDIPQASIFIEPTTVLMSVGELVVPRADFWFHPELFRFPPERGDWEFVVRDFKIDNWRWVNQGFTVDHVSTEVEGINLEAGGRMAFPSHGDERTITYDVTGGIEALYQSTALEYFTGGNIRFDVPRIDVEVAGDFDEIQGTFDVVANLVNLNGFFFEDLRGQVEMDGRLLIAEELIGKFYGGDLRAEDFFFSILDTRFGGELFVDGTDPRAMMMDMVGQDQPFLEGELEGGISMIGQIPKSASFRPSPVDPVLLDVMARYIHVEVIEELSLERSQTLLFPNQTIKMQPGSEFWLDQRLVGLPQATVISGGDRVDVRDFYLEYGGMNFESVDGSEPTQLRASIAEIAPYATYYGLHGLTGPARFTMTMDGYFGSPEWELSGRVDEPIWKVGDEERFHGEFIELELEGRDGVIDIERMHAETDFGVFEVVGSADWFEPPPQPQDPKPWPIWEDRRVQPLRLDVDVQGLEMAVISPLIHHEMQTKGRVDGRLELAGTYQTLLGDFEAEFNEGTVREQYVHHAAIRGAFEQGGVRVDKASVDLADAGTFDGDGRYGYAGDFSFNLEGEDVDLEEIRELDDMPMQLGGELRFHMAGHGDGSDPVFSAGAQVRDMAVDGRTYGDVAVAADTVDGVVHISGGLLPWLTASIELPLRGPAPYYARLGMEGMELMAFLPELRHHPMLDDVVTTGTAELFFERDFSRYQAIFNLTDLQIESRGQQVSNRGPVIVGYNNGEVLTFQRATFESGGRNFSLEGAIGFMPSLLDIRVEGDLDLALLQSVRAGFPDYFPEYFVDASGYAMTDINIRGPQENFVADGTMQFGRSEWELRFLPEPVTLQSGMMIFDDRGIEIPTDRPLDGTLLGGATRVAGTIGYLGDGPHAMDLQFWSHNMSYRIPDLATLAFDTNLRLQAWDWPDFETWLVSGELDILDGLYTQEFNIVEQQLTGRVMGAFQPRTDQYQASIFETVPILNDIRFDMWVRARDGFRLESQVERMEMDLEFRFDLLLQDTLANPRVTGDVDVIGGEVSFQGEAFEVRSGTVRFSGDMGNPYLDIQAGADVRDACEETEFMDEVSPAMTLSSNMDDTGRDYHIMMNIQGDLGNLDLHLESNPYADQRDILSLLLTGCTVDKLTATGASRPTLEVALGPLLGRLEREIQDVVAVDEFTILPGVERTQVRIGDTLTRRWSWRFQLDTGFTDATGGHHGQLEVKLSDRWTGELSERSHMETNNILLDLKLNYRLPID